MKNLLTTPLGSILKVGLSTILTALYVQYQDGTLCFEIKCLQTLAGAAIFAMLPMIINYLNPNYTGYGINKGTEIHD
jgi:hypothetical protein